MDWMFYLMVLGVLFFAISAMLAIRYLFGLRLERLEKKQRMEEEARQIAESNSGLTCRRLLPLPWYCQFALGSRARPLRLSRYFGRAI